MTRTQFRNIFPTPDDLRSSVDSYFRVCEEEGDFASLAGLIRFLGLNSRDDLFAHLTYKGYGDSIRYALLRIEELYERRASLLKNPAGPLFVLKALGWGESIIPKGDDESDKKGSGKITVEIVKP